MTIEKLLDLPTDELGRLVNDRVQLDRILAPYLQVTRPLKRSSTIPIKQVGSSLLQQAMAGTLIETKKTILSKKPS